MRKKENKKVANLKLIIIQCLFPCSFTFEKKLLLRFLRSSSFDLRFHLEVLFEKNRNVCVKTKKKLI